MSFEALILYTGLRRTLALQLRNAAERLPPQITHRGSWLHDPLVRVVGPHPQHASCFARQNINLKVMLDYPQYVNDSTSA